MRKLILTPAPDFKQVWSDAGTGASPHDLQLFEPVCAPGTFSLGVVGVRNGKSVFTLNASEDASEGDAVPLLAPAIQFVELWNDKGTGAKFGSLNVWRPIPPPDYVALGLVVTTDRKAPPANISFRCVHKSCVTDGDILFESDGSFLWCDRCTGAKANMCLWNIAATSCAGFAPPVLIFSTLYARPKEVVQVLRTDSITILGDIPAKYAPVQEPVLALDGEKRAIQQQLSSSSSRSSNSAAALSDAPPSYADAVGPLEVPTPAAPSYAMPSQQALTSAPSALAPYTYSVPFNISPEQQGAIFRKWKDGLWFTSSAYHSSKHVPLFQVSYVPYYLISARIETRYTGQVRIEMMPDTTVTHRDSFSTTHTHHGRYSQSHDKVTVSQTYRSVWRLVGPGSTFTSFVDEAVPAAASPRIRKLLGNLGSFSIDPATLGIIVGPGQTVPGPDGTPLECPVAFEQLWTDTCTHMIESASEQCRREVQSSQGAAETKIAITALVHEPHYRLVYLPVYQGDFEVEGTAHKILIHGQTGKCTGERTYGLGALGASMSTIGRSLSGSAASDGVGGIISGAQLNQQDNTNSFSPEAHFLILPPSAWASMGWFTLVSHSSQDIELLGQRRDKKWGMFLFKLRPGKKVSVNYKGHVVVRIMSGNKDELAIEAWGASGGTGTNLLGLE
ncbi:hypothetical protein CAOG_02767 [Capsaspora owczarzaki ATCC 30864]|uniref:Uncharacterized protein n=1 Tax=Capsaspora owczarzaki (strain ATCC 30864) TaxID=595528 RepID=A0A0D2X1Z3_CAPO3|nr:hypothetical protein CAOG_02767 [Capsaspora owczarzaki ATCC 30864]KJE91659.1 hypothetical protein CAOG_002767 [Capsaspora owczarzaki ATCC 30864]|eukprot:XP_004349520.1 hypothetical protein CAOG_02767 [Capsaspora owczarzaki ATCC 30864]